MGTVTVNVSFQNSLLSEIDAEAKRESRSRSELLREAARSYIRRQREWNAVFGIGDAVAKSEGLKESDVDRAIRSVRKRKPTTS